MKIAVINFSGNVGKTTMARHLLAPRIDNATVIAVETINGDDCESMRVRGAEFGYLLESIMSLDAAVVDIGASNVDELVARMKSYAGSHEDFDMFVVPAVAETKQQYDTISTIEALADDVGVDPERIRVVLNMVDPREAAERAFPMLFRFHDAHRGFVLRDDAAVYESELFGKLAHTPVAISDLLEDTTDYKAMIGEARTPEEKIELARKVAIRRLAAGVNAQLDCAFAALTR